MSFHPLLPAVLVVDDQLTVRRLSYRMLSEAGFRVYEASGAAEALSVLEETGGRIRLTIIDVVMPDIDGIELSQMILDRWPNQLILFMSAHPAEIMVRHGLENPLVHFLAKPFTAEQLVAKVSEAIDRRLMPRPRGPARPPRD